MFTKIYSYIKLFFFFFQAEDGIRDATVTGVQTCALPISPVAPAGGRAGAIDGDKEGGGAGGDPRHRGDHRAGRGVGYRQGGAGLLRAGAQCAGGGQAGAGGADLPDDDQVAAGAGRPAAAAGGDPGGDGGNQRLLAEPVLPAGGPRV